MIANVSSSTFLFVKLKATVFDAQGNELSGERGASTAFSGEGEDHRYLEEMVWFFCVPFLQNGINI